MIILLTLAEVALNEGKDIKKLIYSFIKVIPETVLTNEDKKSRRRQIKALLEKVHSNYTSEFDISVELIKLLEN